MKTDKHATSRSFLSQLTKLFDTEIRVFTAVFQASTDSYQEGASVILITSSDKLIKTEENNVFKLLDKTLRDYSTTAVPHDNVHINMQSSAGFQQLSSHT